MTARALIIAILAASQICAAGEGGLSAWRWTSNVPVEARTKVARSNRNPTAVDRFFEVDRGRAARLDELLRSLGTPENFSRQFIGTEALGSAHLSKHGGTLRFALDDGGECHVWTPDFQSVGLAIRFDREHKAHLLFK